MDGWQPLVCQALMKMHWKSLRWWSPHSGGSTQSQFWQRMSCHIAQFSWHWQGQWSLEHCWQPVSWVGFSFRSPQIWLGERILRRFFFAGSRKSSGGLAGILPSAIRWACWLRRRSMSAAVLQQILKHLPYGARVSGPVVLCDKTGCLALDLTRVTRCPVLIWVPHCCSIFKSGATF